MVPSRQVWQLVVRGEQQHQGNSEDYDKALGGFFPVISYGN